MVTSAFWWRFSRARIPLGVISGFAAGRRGLLASGGMLQRAHDLPDATISVLQGILFLFILLSEPSTAASVSTALQTRGDQSRCSCA